MVHTGITAEHQHIVCIAQGQVQVVNHGHHTHALLTRVGEAIDGRFDDYETCLVWDDDLASPGINRYLGNEVVRRFAVWYDDVAA